MTTNVSWTELSAAIAANPFRSTGCGLVVGTASATVAVLPEESSAGVPWLPDKWTEETTFTASDVLSFVLWVQDPMYRAAEVGSRRVQEQEVAATLQKSVETEWRKHHGKARGWVRKHLEEDLRGRASGADPVADFWTQARTVRRVATFVDFIATVMGIHVSLWCPVAKTVSMIPLTGAVSVVGIANLNAETGRPLLSPSGVSVVSTVGAWKELVGFAETKGIHWNPPASAPSMGTMTVAQIQERLLTIRGATAPKLTGNRLFLWNRLHWELLVRELAGEGGVTLAMLTDDSTGSGASGE